MIHAVKFLRAFIQRALDYCFLITSQAALSHDAGERARRSIGDVFLECASLSFNPLFKITKMSKLIS